ncbi:type II secretion system protein GspL [Desulfofustis glycolicus]|uniref:Type II secretion system protein L n=1 Tax=Desulfofustis glycolicus DSM 9705 TaxID=1121409 RepID=A0A1M5XEN4_9BACT|nr:type II secretion system protein GspL [Desulfofustis glycolicus]SHH98335.1 type II secretion system protein L [Desulfofustis glycolicus DSM 9705]
MADTSILALDISDDAVGGVLYSEGKRSAPAILATHFRQLNGDTDLGTALAEVLDRCGARGKRCLVSFGASHFHYRLLHLPFSDQKKVRSVLPYELEDSSSTSDEDFVFDCLLEAAEDGGTDVVAVLVKKETMRTWLDLLLTHGLDPELVTVTGIPAAQLICRKHQTAPDDGVLLHLTSHRSLLILLQKRTIRAIRILGSGLGATKGSGLTSGLSQGESPLVKPDPAFPSAAKRLAIDIANTLLALQVPDTQRREPSIGLIGSTPAQQQLRYVLAQELQADVFDTAWLPFVEIDNQNKLDGPWPQGSLDQALALACCLPKDRERLNLRTGEFARQGGGLSRPLKFGALAVAALLCVAVFSQVFDYQTKKQQLAEQTKLIASLYEATLPDARPGPDPLKELQVKVNELRETATIGTGHDPSVSIVKLLADISGRIEPSLKVSFERFVYDRKTIRIRGLTDTFNTVDVMKQALEQSPLYSEVSIGSANMSQKEQLVRFELKLDLNVL